MPELPYAESMNYWLSSRKSPDANIDPILLDGRISPAVKHTYTCIRAVAGSALSVRFEMADFLETFGLNRQTFYRHLAQLVKCDVLEFGSPSGETGVMEVCFGEDGSLNNETNLPQDKPASLKNETTGVSKLRQNLKIETDGISKMRQNDDKSLNIETNLPENEPESLKNETKNAEVKLINLNSTATSTSPESEAVEEGGMGGGWIESLKNETITGKNGRGVTKSGICQAIFTDLTGMVTYPGSVDIEQVETVIWRYYQEAGEDAKTAAAALKPYWAAWSIGKRKNGRSYSRTNLSWLTDWATARDIPEQPKVKITETAEQIEVRRQKAAKLLEMVE